MEKREVICDVTALTVNRSSTQSRDRDERGRTSTTQAEQHGVATKACAHSLASDRCDVRAAKFQSFLIIVLLFICLNPVRQMRPQMVTATLQMASSKDALQGSVIGTRLSPYVS